MTDALAICWSEIEDWSEIKAEVLKIATADPRNTKRRDEIAEELGADWEGAREAVFGIYAEALAKAEPKKIKSAAAEGPVKVPDEIKDLRRQLLGGPVARKAAEPKADGRIKRRKFSDEPAKPAFNLEAEIKKLATPTTNEAATSEAKQPTAPAKPDPFFSAGPQPGVESEPAAESSGAAKPAAEEAKSKGLDGGALIPAVFEGEILLPTTAVATAWVETLNQKHAVIGNHGGKCVVLSWERWDLNPKHIIPTFQTFEDFKNRYINRHVEKETSDGTRRVPVGKFWLENPKRLTYERVVFAPGEPERLPGNRLNLWRGFAVEPRPGEWRRMRDHTTRSWERTIRKLASISNVGLRSCFKSPRSPQRSRSCSEAKKGPARECWAVRFSKSLAPTRCRFPNNRNSSEALAATSSSACFSSSMKHFGRATTQSKAG